METAKRQIRRGLGVSILMAFLICVWCVVGVSEVPKSSCERYSQGWKFSYNGQEKLVDIPASQKVEAGDSYEISRVISRKLMPKSRLLFRSIQQSVEIYVDGVMLYKYPEKEYPFNLTPSNWNMVELPDDIEGKLLTIRLRSEYEQFSGKIGEIYLGEYDTIFYHVREKSFGALAVGLMVGFIGCSILFVGIFTYPKKSYRAETALGILFILTSFWLCGQAKMPFIKISSLTQYFLIYLSLLLIPIFFYLYIYFRMREGNKKISLKILWAMLIVLVGCTFLQLTGIRDYPEMLPVIQGTVVLVFLYGIMVIGRELFRKSGIFKKQEYGFVILFLLALCIEIVHFYRNQYKFLGICIRLTLVFYACAILLTSSLKMYRITKEKHKLAGLLQESRVTLMISQIQPHFIYNALNSIRTLIHIEPEQAYDMVYDFSQYLRAHIDSLSNEREITFSKELEHIKSYINIEKVRFGERLKVEFDIQTTSFYLPALSVQPLVENAIKHGICKKPEGGTVWIRSYEDEDHVGGFVVEVEDNGVGFDVQKWQNSGNKHKSAGISNIRFRIQTISKAQLFIESEINSGTKAIIKFPDRGGVEHKQ